MPPVPDAKLTTQTRQCGVRSLHVRILIALIVVFALGFGSQAMHQYGTRDEVRRAVLIIQAGALTEGLRSASEVATLPRYYGGSEIGYTLYSSDGRLMWFSDNLKWPRPLRRSTLQNGFKWWRWSPLGGRVINVPIELPDGSVVMVTREDKREGARIDKLLRERLLQSLVVTVPIGLISLVLIVCLLRWTLRPVSVAASLAKNIGPSNPDLRIPLDALPREILPLACAANDALDRLAQAYSAEKTFVADAAHELRTPLTVLDLRLQDARHSLLPDWSALDQEMRNIRRMINQLLSLARQEGGRGQAPQERMNVARVAREAAASLLPIFEAKRRTLTLSIGSSAIASGFSGDLRDAVTNLLENALLHGAGAVTISVRIIDHEILVEVSDEGPGVPSSTQDDMFKRFRKGNRNCSGSGLGLAIARRVVQNLGGSIRFLSDRPATVQIRLPAVRHESSSGELERPENQHASR